MGSFHTDCLGKLADTSTGSAELESQVFTFELFPGFPERQIKNLGVRRVTGGLRWILTECFVDFIHGNLTLATEDQQALNQVPQFPDISWPAMVP